jgi:hypothetical protein
LIKNSEFAHSGGNEAGIGSRTPPHRTPGPGKASPCDVPAPMQAGAFSQGGRSGTAPGGRGHSVGQGKRLKHHVSVDQVALAEMQGPSPKGRRREEPPSNLPIHLHTLLPACSFAHPGRFLPAQVLVQHPACATSCISAQVSAFMRRAHGRGADEKRAGNCSSRSGHWIDPTFLAHQKGADKGNSAFRRPGRALRPAAKTGRSPAAARGLSDPCGEREAFSSQRPRLWDGR